MNRAAGALFLPSYAGTLLVMQEHPATIQDTGHDSGHPECWLRGEPRLEELLQDPVLLLVLRQSKTSADEIRRLADRVERSPFH